jgi:glycosyltransferase involved in cell wall biosynthesis
MVSEYLAAARALILPSVAPNEAFGLVQIEAMALGKPIINTDLKSGVPWVARDGLEAITVKPSDAAALRQAVVRLDTDEALRLNLAKAARQRWNELFREDVFQQNTEKLYLRLITEKLGKDRVDDSGAPLLGADQQNEK